MPNDPIGWPGRGYDVVTLHSDLRNTLAFLGIVPTSKQRRQFDEYATWLVSEAAQAGGIGPNEGAIIENRHIADSLLYLPPEVEGSTLLDVGSGAGLPGLVLAIAHPHLAVTVLDRSGRRAGLLKRATRVVGLDNVSVRQADIKDVESRFDIVTVRAVFPTGRAVREIERLSPNYGVVGLSRVAETSVEYDEPTGYAVVERKFEVLEPASWMLIMTRV